MEAAIELVGMGKFQYVILVASGMCFASDAMQVILLSFLTIVLKGEWNLSGGAAASIASCLFAGSLVGTLVLGPLADSVGRRPIFLVSAAVISVAGFCTASAPNLVTLMACIFIVGFGVGGLTVPFDILAELLPAEGRGHHLLLIEYFWTAGCLYVVVVAYFFAERHWRILAALSTVPCVISLVLGFFVVPESPRWLSARGRREEAMNILRNAAAVNGRNVDHVLPPSLSLMQEPEEKHASLAELFEPKWREIILRLWGTWCKSAF
jgi:MFS family permease